MNQSNHKIASIVYDGFSVFEYGVAVELFALPRPGFDRWYDFHTCCIEGKTATGLGGVVVNQDTPLSQLSDMHTIIVPGWRDIHEQPPQTLLTALIHAHTQGCRIVSFCSGAFVLAAAGLLDNKQATTHWKYAQQLQNQYPDISVEPDVLFIDEGQVMTAAGSAAAIDISLYLIRKDFGADIAHQVSRALVLPLHREGGQAQFIEQPITDTTDSRIQSAIRWVNENFQEKISVAAMADKSNMSLRTFCRQFETSTGTSPGKWLIQTRLNHAQRLLETTKDSVEVISAKSGFGTSTSLRNHFNRAFHISPATYRKQFQP